MFDNAYLASLPKNKLLAANRICNDFFAEQLKERPSDVVFMLETLLEEELGSKAVDNLYREVGRGVLGSIFRAAEVFVGATSSFNSEKRIRVIHRHVKALIAKATITKPSEINMFLIELSQDETARIDDLLRDVRSIIRDRESIKEDHKRRLLGIVNSLQGELDKQYSDFRVFLDGMIDVSEAVGEAGENVKPVFDRVKELFGIADKARKLQEALEAPDTPVALPAPPKELPPPE